ncbi:DUF6985 domain-containing protein [Flavobacterium sp. N2038]|uniref:DUF6985 domain-containing protein n=1 Tax=Flavobacterium sp. N2038 TaxID=2986829 RepID=UPI002224C701|nr:hypothetical protein [Flavobacterium sp. N2038]
MTIHPYWGNIEEDWAGYSSDIYFSYPFFENSKTEVFLGDEYDEDGEEIETPPTEKQLTAFAATYKSFIDNIENHLADLQLKAFDRYNRIYAKYYENSEQSGEPPLDIDTTEKHNAYIKDIMYVRILDDKTIKVTIRYKLDTEHGIEFKFVEGQIEDVGGISET